MSGLRRTIALLSLALAGVFAGCAGASADDCARNSDCDAGYCLDGKCRQDCVDSEKDCPKGYVCSVVGKCELGAAGTSGAGGAASAGSGGASTGGAGQAGLGGVGGTLGGSPPQGGAGTGGKGASAGAGGGPSSGSGGFGPAAGAELDACSADGDCAPSLRCRADLVGGARRCTRPCTSSAECLGGRRCEEVEGAAVCVMGDVGRACAAADDCLFGCLINQKYCTTSCQTGGDCPNGYACQAVGSPPMKVCAKVAAPCDAGTSECIAQAACDSSANLIVLSCTAACTTAVDCPVRAVGLAPWTCDGVCRRPPDVKGPLEGGSTPAQYACDGKGTVVNLCNDAQHLDFAAFDIPKPPVVSCSAQTTTSGSAGDACVDSCRYKGGCAAGFACTAVGGLNGGRIGLCLPVGSSPVGSPCQSGTECDFGYCANGKCSRDCSADGLCPTGSGCVAGGGPAVEGMAFRRCE